MAKCEADAEDGCYKNRVMFENYIKTIDRKSTLSVLCIYNLYYLKIYYCILC